MSKLKKAAGSIFFLAWALCGCSVDSMLDDWRSCVAAVAALIVAISCVVILNWKEK